MSHDEVWLLWGQYSNEAEVRAARHYFRVRLGFPGPQLHSVHPVPPGGLDVLNYEEQRMLRQHLEHMLREDVQDETREAVGETLLNLNTLANGRRVHMSSGTDFVDGTRTSDIDHGEPDCDGDFNLEDPPPRSRKSSKIPNHDDREQTPCSRPSSDSYAKYVSGNHQGESSRPDATYGTRSGHGDSYGRGDLSHIHSGIRLRRSRSTLRQSTPDRETFLQDQQPGSPASTGSEKRTSRSDDHKMHSMDDDAYIRRERMVYEEEFARDFEDKLNLDQQDLSRESSAQQAERGHISDRRGDRRRDHGDHGDRYDQRRDDRDTRRSSYRASPYESSERPISAGIHDKYEHTYEAGRSSRYENQHRSKDLRNSMPINAIVGETLGTVPGNILDIMTSAAWRIITTTKPIIAGRSHRNESTFGPFNAELIFSVIQKGERADFFNALYELHPEHAPRTHRATRMRKSWLSWKYMPLIVKLLRKGSVRDIEEVFDRSNMDDLFRGLKGEISSRRNLW